MYINVNEVLVSKTIVSKVSHSLTVRSVLISQDGPRIFNPGCKKSRSDTLATLPTFTSILIAAENYIVWFGLVLSYWKHSEEFLLKGCHVNVWLWLQFVAYKLKVSCLDAIFLNPCFNRWSVVHQQITRFIHEVFALHLVFWSECLCHFVL